MKINLVNRTVDPNDLKAKLEAKFPQYHFSFRSKNLLNVKKTSTIGTTVLVRKNSLIINGNFPSMGAQLVFTICLLLLGILIPLIIYFAAFHGKMKSVEREISGYVQNEYLKE